MPRTHAAVVLTAVHRFSDGRMSGYWLPEAAYPWLALAKAGWTVLPISTQSGRPASGGVDRSDPVQRCFLDDTGIQHLLDHTEAADFYHGEDFGVVVYAGGGGALSDLPEDAALNAFTGEVAASGGVVAASGHGVAGLLNVRDSDGRSILQGRRVTGTTAVEEHMLELDDVLPFLLSEELTRRGAGYSFEDPFRPYVVADGLLITGQNPASAPQLAKQIISATAGPSSADGNEGRSAQR